MRFSWTEWLPWKRWRIGATVEAANDVPVRLPPRVAILVGSASRPKWIAFDCPCGKSHRIMVSLDPATKPHWRVLASDRLSLAPSIDAWRGRRRCHYVIRSGKIAWV